MCGKVWDLTSSGSKTNLLDRVKIDFWIGLSFRINLSPNHIFLEVKAVSIAGYLYFLFISQDIRPWKRSALARDWSEGTSKLYGSRIPAKWYNLQKTCLALMKLLNTLYMLENRVWQLLLRKYNVKLAKLLTKQSRKKGYCANIQKQLKPFFIRFLTHQVTFQNIWNETPPYWSPTTQS